MADVVQVTKVRVLQALGRRLVVRVEAEALAVDPWLAVATVRAPALSVRGLQRSCQQWKEDQMLDCRIACSGTPGSPSMSLP